MTKRKNWRKEALYWSEQFHRLSRKVAHGCTDVNCAVCDAAPDVMELSGFEFGHGVLSRLYRNGIETTRQLLELSAMELMCQQNISRRTLDKIRDGLSKAGLKLNGD